jgi:hypothetical protein
MNERIKELWERACTRYSVYETLKPQDERKIIPDIFAELIVQECLKIAKNREDEFESAGLLEQSNAVGNVAYRISRQFGVKR